MWDNVKNGKKKSQRRDKIEVSLKLWPSQGSFIARNLNIEKERVV
jgi:hypothetical protein